MCTCEGVYAAPRTRPAAIIPKDFTALCADVTDGDILRVKFVSSQNESFILIRLFAADAPERDQSYGAQAKDQLASRALGKDLHFYSKGFDKNGVLMAWVFRGSSCINTEMVRSGFAWWDSNTAPSEHKLGDIQAQARSKKLGLWRDENPTAPWEWRRGKRRNGEH